MSQKIHNFPDVSAKSANARAKNLSQVNLPMAKSKTITEKQSSSTGTPLTFSGKQAPFLETKREEGHKIQTFQKQFHDNRELNSDVINDPVYFQNQNQSKLSYRNFLISNKIAEVFAHAGKTRFFFDCLISGFTLFYFLIIPLEVSFEFCLLCNSNQINWPNLFILPFFLVEIVINFYTFEYSEGKLTFKKEIFFFFIKISHLQRKYNDRTLQN